MSEAAAVALRDVAFAHPGGTFRLHVPEFSVAAGEHLALVGPSGSGKTTLAHLVAGIHAADSGEIDVLGRDLRRLAEAARRRFRATSIGFVFQAFELLDYLSARENILLPCRIARLPRLDPLPLARALGIEPLLDRKPAALSQGEAQRVAIARALLLQPGLVIADEPTGNLDPDTARRTVDLLLEQTRARGAALLFITHDHSLLDRFDRTVDLAG